MSRALLKIFSLCLLSCALCGTAAAQPAVPLQGGNDAASPTSPGPLYRVGRGDGLNFRFLCATELSTIATVRPDGRLALPLAGEFAAEGLTVDELKTKAQALISSQVLRPQVVVNVQHGAGQRVFVGGEVGRPGVQPLVGSLTALQAVRVAEGMRDTAQPCNAVVLRRGPTGDSRVLPVGSPGC